MAAINSLTKVPGLLGSNPVLVVPLVVLYLLTSIQTVSQSLDPIVGSIIALVVSGVLFFAGPLFHGGTIGMANEAATSTRTSLGSFIFYGKQYYLSVLGAYLLSFAILIALFLAGGIAAAIVAVIYLTVSDSLVVLAVGGLFGVLLVCVYLVVSMLLQFYAHAIVIEAYSAVNSLKRSAVVVRQNLISVVGYFAVLLVGGAVMTGVYVVLLWVSPVDFFAEPGTVTLTVALTEALLTVVVLAPAGAVYLVYSVVFYRSLLGEGVSSGGSVESTAASTERSV